MSSRSGSFWYSDMKTVMERPSSQGLKLQPKLFYDSMCEDQCPSSQRLNWNTVGEGLTLHTLVPAPDSTEQQTPQPGKESPCTAADAVFCLSAGRAYTRRQLEAGQFLLGAIPVFKACLMLQIMLMLVA